MFVIRMMDLSTGSILYVTGINEETETVSYSLDMSKAKEFVTTTEVEKWVKYVKEICITHVAVKFVPVKYQVFCAKEFKYVSELKYFRDACVIGFDGSPLMFDSVEDAKDAFLVYIKRFKRDFKFHKKEVEL